MNPRPAVPGNNKQEEKQMEPQTIKKQTKDELEIEIVCVKQARKDIDEVIQDVKNLKRSREVSLCITKLQEAVMWLGMDLKRINEENPGANKNPYPNSYNPSNTVIEPTADGLKL